MTQQINFDNFTENYNAQLKEQTKFFTSNDSYFAQYKVNITQKMSNKPNRILEFGCGIGRNISFLKKAFPEAKIFGSDISVESLTIASELNPGITFFSEEELTDREEQFDLIFIAGVYHHIPCMQQANVTKLLHNRLNPGGQLIIFEHNPYNPVTRKIVSSCPYDKGVILLAPKKLKKYIREAGFESYQQGYCLFFPPGMPFITKLEPYLKWLPFGGQYWLQATK